MSYRLKGLKGIRRKIIDAEFIKNESEIKKKLSSKVACTSAGDNEMWTIEQIEKHGFKLIDSDKLWCHFRGNGFDVFINLDTKQVTGNYFNFHSDKLNLKGHFRAVLSNDEEMETLLRLIQ